MGTSVIRLGDLESQGILRIHKPLLRLKRGQRADRILLTVLEGGRHKVEPDIIDHHVAANRSTEDLVRILAVRHASDHASLESESPLL